MCLRSCLYVVFPVVYAACMVALYTISCLCSCTCFVMPCFLIPTVTLTTGCDNELWLALPNYVCIVFRDYGLNVIQANVANLNWVFVENFV